MAKMPAAYTDFVTETIEALHDPGCLLAVQDRAGKPNAMTIGWGTLGIIWGRPIFVVLVRPSRFTWEILAQATAFSVNVPTPDLAKAVALCGSRSGRDLDKLAAAGLTAIPGKHADAPLIEECVLHYECHVVYRSDLDPTVLSKSVLDGCYPSGDFHTIFYGEILGVVADDDVAAKLRR